MHTYLAIALLALAPLAQAQEQPLDPDEPIQPTQSKPAQRPLPSIPAPVVDAPGLSNVDLSLPARRLYTEGTFLPARRGTLIRARTGDIIFLADTAPDARPARPEPPMILLAGQRLAQIDTAMSAPAFSGRAGIGGQVFVYRDRHYLLPTLFTPLAPDAEPQPKEPAPAPPSTPQDPDPRIEDLIKDLESQRSAPRAITPLPAPAAQPEPDQPRANLLPEGTILVFRRARLIRLADHAGRIALAFDNDPDSPAPPPMLIEPCAQLQRIESLAASRGDSTPLKVSGRVLTYKGRNHLLPTFVQAISPGEVVPMQ
jgi:hypothetical protein